MGPGAWEPIVDGLLAWRQLQNQYTSAIELRRALHERNATTEPSGWGGPVGLTWMAAYWATLIPLWVFVVVQAAA